MQIRGLLFPPNRVAKQNVERMAEALLQGAPRPVVLIVGGGTIGSGLEWLYARRDMVLLGFDVYRSPHTAMVADGHEIPIRSGSVDGVIVQAVLEHVLDPARVAAEIHRVLKPGGVVYAETPFMQHVHEGPQDFTRFTESGHRYLFRRFDRIDSGVVAGSGTQLMWSIEHFARSLFRSRAAGIVARVAFAWLQVFDRLIPERHQIDAASCVFFLGAKNGHELLPADLQQHYRGVQSSPRRS